jgi:peroxiredoxin
MRKIIYIVLCLLAGIYSETVNAQKIFTIRGQMKNVPSATWIYLEKDWADPENQDSMEVKEGRFSYTGRVGPMAPSLGFLYMSIIDEKTGKRKKHMVTDLFIEEGKINIVINGIGFRDSSTVTGSKTNAEYQEYQKLKDTFLRNRQCRMDSLGNARPKGMPAIEEYRAGVRNLAVGYVKQHPSSYYSLFLLESELFNISKPEQLITLFNNLNPVLKESPKGQVVKRTLTNAAIVKVNTQAPDFTENDTTGLPVSLNNFRGKYVLVDFWASWCHPCRDEHPYLRATYSKFKDRNFTILSVSMDKSRSAWIKAIHDDNLAWQQVSALDPQKSESAFLYGVKSVPKNFLIDPSGKIIAIDLRKEAVEQKLQELLH